MTASVRPEQLVPVFPATVVLGGERSGVSPEVINAADAAVAIPMLGMANSLNVATTPRYCFTRSRCDLKKLTERDFPWSYTVRVTEGHLIEPGILKLR